MKQSPKPYRLVRPEGAPLNLRIRVPIDEEPEAKEPPEPIEPPAWLGVRARKIFATRAGQIQASGYWEPRFEDSLALLASLMSAYQRGPAKMPSAKVTQMRLLLSELGLTPASSRSVDRR